jgi:carbon-monoxide dehydrogenase large subunit
MVVDVKSKAEGIVEILDYVGRRCRDDHQSPLAAGQIHGGVVQGIAQALYEEVS